MNSTILYFIGLSFLCFWLWTRRHLYAFCLRTPGYWGLPFLGEFLRIRDAKNFLPLVRQAFENLNSNTICIWFGLSPILLTKDPIFIEKLLTSAEVRERPTNLTKAGNDMVGNSLTNSIESKWQRNRKLLVPFFKKSMLFNFQPIFNGIIEVLSEKFSKLDTEKGHAVFDDIREAFFSAASVTILSDDPKNNLTALQNYINDSKRARIVLFLKFVLNYLNISGVIPNNSNKIIKNFIQKRVNLKLDAGKSHSSESPQNFLEFAKKLHESNQLSKQDIYAESHTLFETGSESIALAVYSTLILLAMQPGIQEKLYEELKIFLSKDNLNITFEDLESLPYLHMVTNESLRLIPPVPLIPRTILKDTKINDDWYLPKGLDVYISVFDLHKRKDIWGSDAEEFNPEHFSAENMQKLPPSAFLPFSKGARNCIGSRYALYAFKIVLAGLIRRFEFHTNAKLKDLRFSFKVGIEYIDHPKLQIIAREK